MGGNPSKARKEDLELYPGSISDFDQVPTPLMENCDPSKTREIQNLEGVFDITDDPTSKGIESDENYGIIPLNTIHNVMLYQLPTDLLSMALSCRLFFNSQNTSYFWKSYYRHYFKTDKNDEKSIEKEEENMNWKKQFFKRFFLYGDDYYRRKYTLVGKEMMKNGGGLEVIMKYDGGTNEKEQIPPFKVVMLGDGSTGKTSYLHRLVIGSYQERLQSTIGATFNTISIQYETKQKNKKCVIRLEIWDTAGNERYRALAPMYYRGSNGVLVFYSIDSLDSFNEAKKWVKEIHIHGTKRINITLVGSKSDLGEDNSDHNKREVFFSEHVEPFLSEMARSKNVSGRSKKFRDTGDVYFTECSSKDGVNLFRVLGLTVDGVLRHSKLLEEKFNRENNIITV